LIVRISPQKFSGIVRIPASKSHTIRQLLIASLADGISEILCPLDSLDTRSCISACRVFGAQIDEQYDGENLIKLIVKGNANFRDSGHRTENKIDVGNSGTTLYLALALAGLQNNPIQFTGDEQIQKRSAAPLLEALASIGVKCQSNNGCAPITVQGPWAGGKVVLSCPTSQYLSAMLIAAPLAPAGAKTEINVPLLNELPYIEMTLSYLKAQGIPYKADFFSSVPAAGQENPNSGYFVVNGGYSYKSFTSSVPGDFSSAAFPAAAAAITGGIATLYGLDPQDTQGDKFFLEMLQEMGCEVSWSSPKDSSVPENTGNSVVISRSKPLKGGTFNLNKTPDMLPAAAAVAAYANGDTVLTNVAHARIKETDRIAVMAQELAKLGVKCTEKPDGLVIHGKGGLENPKNSSSVPLLEGHGDHRVVMALAVAALGGQSPVEITSAESAQVTYPGFFNILQTI
jgi:3-phosphoshikimate 1-carboxyvinyltransferase